MLASIDAGDWTAIATVGAFLIVLGGVIQKSVSRRLDKRRKRRQGARKTEAAVWGSPKTEFDPEQPGLIKIVADLAKQVEKQGAEQDESRKKTLNHEERIVTLERRGVA